MTKTGTCLVCEGPAELTYVRPLEYHVDCPRCGQWETIDPDGDIAGYEILEPRYLLCAWLRDRFRRTGKPFTLADRGGTGLPTDITDLPVIEKVDRALLLVADKTSQLGEEVLVDLDVDYPITWTRNAAEFHQLLDYVRVGGFIAITATPAALRAEKVRCHVTAAGWREVARLRPLQPHGNQAFVAMSFAPELDEAYEGGFRPGIERAGYKPYRVDREHYAEKIDDHILASIRRSGLLVVDLTGLRHSVLFEAGFAMGLGIPLVWTCRRDEVAAVSEKAFDTRQYPLVVWEEPTVLATQVQERIEALYPRR